MEQNSKKICLYCTKFIPKDKYKDHFQRHIELKNKRMKIEEENKANVIVACKFFQECQQTFNTYFQI
jgi:hypothetical protein